MSDKRRPWWSQTQRDLEGAAARRERAKSQAGHDQVGELARAADTDAVPDAFEGPDTGITKRINEDPDLARLYARDEHTREQVRSMVLEARKDAADRIFKAMGDKPPAEQMSALERTIRRLKVVITVIAVPAVTSAVLVGRYIYDRGVADEGARITLQQERDRVDALASQLDAYARELAEVRDTARRNAALLEGLETRQGR
jgi:hypothetical protein